MYWLIGLGCVFAGPLEYNGLSTWMFFLEFRDIVGTTMDDYPACPSISIGTVCRGREVGPAVLVIVMFSYFFAAPFPLLCQLIGLIVIHVGALLKWTREQQEGVLLRSEREIDSNLQMEKRWQFGRKRASAFAEACRIYHLSQHPCC